MEVWWRYQAVLSPLHRLMHLFVGREEIVGKAMQAAQRLLSAEDSDMVKNINTLVTEASTDLYQQRQ